MGLRIRGGPARLHLSERGGRLEWRMSHAPSLPPDLSLPHDTTAFHSATRTLFPRVRLLLQHEIITTRTATVSVTSGQENPHIVSLAVGPAREDEGDASKLALYLAYARRKSGWSSSRQP
jgi:hypothetical protein